MEKTYKRVPFDIELAKKIQTGEIEGKMFVSDDTHNKIRIICFDRKAAFPKIIALEEDKLGTEWVRECNTLGEFISPIGLSEQTDDTIGRGIIIELPEETPICLNPESPKCKVCSNRHCNDCKYNAKHEFRPFDKVLFRFDSESEWRPAFYDRPFDEGHLIIGNNMVGYCIPYEGNEHLVGTTDEPKELC